MANRVLQAKMIKLKASRRKAYLKRPRFGGVDQGKIVSHDMFQNKQRVITTSGKNGGELPILNNTWLEEHPVIDNLPLNEQKRILNKYIVLDRTTGQFIRTPKGELVKKSQYSEIMDEVVSVIEGPTSDETGNFAKTPRTLVVEQLIEDKKETKAAKIDASINGSFLLGKMRKVWQGIRKQGVSEYHSIELLNNNGISVRLYLSGPDALIVMETSGDRFISKNYGSSSAAMKAFNEQSITWITSEEK